MRRLQHGSNLRRRPGNRPRRLAESRQQKLYDAADTQPLGDLPIPDFAAGATSAAVEIHLWADKGQPAGQGGQGGTNVLLVQQTEDPTRPDVWLAAGLPPQDELWGRVRVIGSSNPGNPAWGAQLTDWQPLGAHAALALGDIPADCAVHLEWQAVVPSTAVANPWRLALAVIHSEYARPAPPLLTALAGGVLARPGDPAVSTLLRGGTVTPSTTPDDRLHLAPALWQHAGTLHGAPSSEHTLDQLDGADPPEALAAGESYRAALVLRAGAPAVLKGLRGAEPAAPLLEPGDVLAARARVHHQPGGTSVLTAQDLDLGLAGRYLLTPGPGLQATLHPGEALHGGSWRYHARPQNLALTDDATSHLWQTAAGLLEVTTTPDPPESTALLLWQVTTAAGAITSVTDRRPWAERTVLLRVAGDTPAAAGDLLGDLLVEHASLQWIATTLRLSSRAVDLGATTGATRVDVEVAGATAYPSAATEDLRPALAYDAPELIDRASVHEHGTLRRGGTVGVRLAERPTGAAPERLEVTLVCLEIN